MIVHSLVKVTTRIHNKSQSKMVPVHNMRAHSSRRRTSLLNSKLDEAEWSTATPLHFTPPKNHSIHWIAVWVGPITKSERFVPVELKHQIVQSVA